jgi:iduronate 2-sulfatase
MKQLLFILPIFFVVLKIPAQGIKKTTKPNVIFIAIDDLKPTIGAFGDEFAKTPVLDKVAKNGTIFTNNHTQQAVCGPSRASLLTGKRPDYTKVRDLKTKMRDINPNILTIPQYFKENGYITAGVGKIYDPRCVDEYRDQPSWSLPFIKEADLNYPQEYGQPALGYYQNKEIKEQITVLRKDAEGKGVSNINKYVRDRYKPPFEISNVPDEAYTDGAITVSALSLLDQVSDDSSKPFFLAVGFKRPHLPFVAPKKYWDLYDKEAIQLAAFQKKSKNSSDLAYHSSGEMRSYLSPEVEYKLNEKKLLEMDEELQKKLIHGYYACVSFVDTQVGKIIEKLKEKDLDKNTIIVVFGDHGWHLGDHSLWNKHSNFEQATRSPLMIYVPNDNTSVKVSSPTEFVDLFPTLCELSGLSIPENLDGKSLLPLINQTNKVAKKYAVSQWHKGKVTGYSFRTDTYRYTVWIDKKKSSEFITSNDIVAQELYDYTKDPLETRNHFGRPEYKVIQKELISYSKAYFNSELLKSKGVQSTSNAMVVGATLNHNELNTIKEQLFLKDFNYLTPANAAKQTKIHPTPKVWNWQQIDDFISLAQKHDLQVRLHGPISPQASKWAKEDHRTPKELNQIMTEFATAFAMRFNSEPSVKWMDVVNETILPNGKWFGPKEGTNKWENPWLKMGLDENGYPLYILKAFEIATKYASNIKLVYNQNAGMQTKMWDKVKETILYIRSKGYRVDGIGWQGHIGLSPTTKALKENTDVELKKLSKLIDWAHQNDLEFHVTELDYFTKDKSQLKSGLKSQAEFYQKLINVLQEKTKSGLVTLNLWDISERTKKGKEGVFQSIYNSKFQPTPSYKIIKKINQ